MLSSARFQSVLGKPYLPPLFFFSGVTYDSFTLTRIDRLVDNLLLLLYLALLGFLIVLTGRLGTSRPVPEDHVAMKPWFPRLLLQARPYAPMAIQFLLGGLFSAYTIFYWKSATFTGTAIFFCLLAALLVANELCRDRLSNLQILIALYALVASAFFTFFLPVMTGWMNTAVFLTGAALSGLVTWRVVQLVYAGQPKRSRREAIMAGAPAIAVISLLIVFYFLNWIPPVPLSMKFGGVFHEVRRVGEEFELSFHKRWYEVWKQSDNPFPADEPVYCFTAVFAPVRLETTIHHHWYHRPQRSRPFAHADRIPIKISGGREGGYRAYTFKQGLTAGDWRVDVETDDGRVLGQVRFTVEADFSERSLTIILY